MDRRTIGLGFVVATTTALMGSAVGFFCAKKVLEKKYADLADEEIEKAKKYFKVLYKVDGYSTPEGAAKELGRDVEVAAATALKVYGGHMLKPADLAVAKKVAEIAQVEEETAQEITRSVFGPTRSTTEEAEAFAEEVRNRTDDVPYVISEEEYMQNDTDYTQISLTFYEGDNVLADDRDDPIPTVDDLVGDNNLLRFGDWSNDPNVVYVRNDVREQEYEITRSQGKFSDEVAGFHS